MLSEPKLDAMKFRKISGQEALAWYSAAIAVVKK
jgi:hypothetical protein